MFSVEKTLQFVALIQRFQKVTRRAYVAGEDRHENDSEHTYMLTMASWYLADSLKMSLDKDLVLKYALVHDLVEAYAGDTVVWDEEGRRTKHAREKKAQERIANEFPEFADLNEYIERYEKREDEESTFVHALDKLLYLFPEYLAEGKTFKEFGVTFEEERLLKRKTATGHPKVAEWLEEMQALLEKEKDRLFAPSEK